MRTAALALLLLGALVSAASDRRMVAEEAGGAIVNGQDASPTRYRYYALLILGSSACGGSLISPDTILTAAHCLFGKHNIRVPASNIRAYVGEYLFDETAPQQGRVTRGVSEVAIHPQYNPEADEAEYDIAVLKLKKPVTSIQPVKLVGSVPKPDWNNPAPDWTPVTVVGLGRTSYQGDTFPTVLQEIGLTLLPARQCQVQLSAAAKEAGEVLRTRFQTNAMICSLKLDGPGAECNGDSGGPMLVTGASAAEDVQIGVVSWSYKNPEKKACLTIPGVFSDVGALFPWVDAQVLSMTGARLTPGRLPIQPFAPVYSRVFGDMAVQGLDGSVFTQPGAPGQAVNIVASPQLFFLTGRLVAGSRPTSAALGSVGLAWGDRVEVRLERGELAASVDSGKNVGPSQSIALSSGGSLTVFANKPGTNRRVDIVKPGVEIRVVQPWIGGASGYAQRLELYFVLTQRPAARLTGFLGATYKP